MNTPSDDLPLADVMRAANGLISRGLIEDWALGGALAAIYYVEPFATYDADIFFIPRTKDLPPAFLPFMSICNRWAGRLKPNICSFADFPCNFWQPLA